MRAAKERNQKADHHAGKRERQAFAQCHTNDAARFGADGRTHADLTSTANDSASE